MSFNFTDSNLADNGQPIKKTHIQELLDGFESVKQNTKFATPFTNACSNESVTSDIPKKISLNDLRTYVNQLETKFNSNCNCLVNTDCCQSCQGCQSCQSYSCQSGTCQSYSCQAGQCQCNIGSSHLSLIHI